MSGPESEETVHMQDYTRSTQPLMSDYHTHPTQGLVVTSQPVAITGTTIVYVDKAMNYNPDKQLVWAICNLLFCCFPLNLIAFISSVVALATQEQNIKAARKFNKFSCRFNTASLVIGLLGYLGILSVAIWQIILAVDRQQGIRFIG